MSQETSRQTILVERDGRGATITLNRTNALNALNAQVMTEVTTAAAEFDADSAIGAIVITGSERHCRRRGHQGDGRPMAAEAVRGGNGLLARSCQRAHHSRQCRRKLSHPGPMCDKTLLFCKITARR